MLSRRSFLAALLLPIAPLPGGRLVRTVPLGRLDGRPAPPFHVMLGSGLDARQFTDLSLLNDDSLITPTERFFVRTSFVAGPQAAKPWTLSLGGAVTQPQTLTLETLAPMVRPMGTHLMECAGNTDPANFGLMSVAQWDGAPIAAVLDRLPARPGSWQVRVTGVDDTSVRTRSSVPGASWVFQRDRLERTGAFLATRMNGADLTPDHGRPVRLVVPGWYGCACIKWVSAIDLVPADEPVTPQMIEFSRRTHQEGQPALAREYEPPAIDLAAMPVRVEQWAVDGRTVYRVVGIVWGGQKPTNALSIRFRHDQPFTKVEHCPVPAATTSWSMWSHTWQPPAPGRYRIVLRSDDPSIRARRLDMFFYARDVAIDSL